MVKANIEKTTDELIEGKKQTKKERDKELAQKEPKFDYEIVNPIINYGFHFSSFKILKGIGKSNKINLLKTS